MTDIPWHLLLAPGDTLAASQAQGEPTALLESLFSAPGAPAGLRLFVGMSLGDAFTRCPAGIAMSTSVGMAPNADLVAQGRMELIPCHMSDLPWLLTEGPLAADVALILVSPPDADGYCSMGLGVDYTWPLVEHARVVVAEVNDRVPVVPGETRIHVDRIAAMLRTDRELPERVPATPTALERSIASRIEPLVPGGACLQIGIGRLGEAVLQSLSGRHDLGIHSGMVGDTLLDLMDQGVFTGLAKSIDTGVAITGSVLGTAKALARIGDGRRLELRPVSYTHSTAVIARLDRFTSVNTALEVDLLGQVNTEYASDRYVGAVGGAVDFLRGAARSHGGLTVVALPSATGSGRPRIVPRVRHVTAPRSDVGVVVTEHGVADLRGASTELRVRALVAIAAPEHRAALETAARGLL